MSGITDIIIRTSNSKATLLIRLMVGVVFLSEGLQKFLFPAIRGAGRVLGNDACKPYRLVNASWEHIPAYQRRWMALIRQVLYLNREIDLPL